MVFLNQDAAGLDNIVGFAVEESYRTNVRLQAVNAQRKNLFGRIRNRVEPGGGLVDTHVGSLCRQDDRNQQLERIYILEFGGGGRRAFA